MRSALTVLFAAGTLLSGCVLPEGKLTAAGGKSAVQRNDAGTQPPHDAALHMIDGAVAGRGGAGGAASGKPAVGAKADGKADDSEDAGSAPIFKPNGDLCTASSECASGNCRTSFDGRRCFGLIAVDRACSGPYDCDGYTCIAASSGAKNGVCVDTSKCGTTDRCSQDYWTATCQLDQLCSEQSSSFNRCYQTACARPRDSKDLCMSELATVNSLIAARCCPPAGAYHSSCDPAPQCGCKDDEKCDVVGKEGQTTCGSAGKVAELEACGTPSDCMIGFMCAEVGCKRYCEGEDDRSCPHGACRPVAFQGIYPPGSYACSHSCDPTSPDKANGPFDACRSEQRCEPAPDGYSDCLPGKGVGRQGASCNNMVMADNHLCAPGFVCIVGSLTCAQYCKVAADDCPDGTKCRSNVGTKLYAFDVEIGYCSKPLD